jgi:hypothetical protein
MYNLDSFLFKKKKGAKAAKSFFSALFEEPFLAIGRTEWRILQSKSHRTKRYQRCIPVSRALESMCLCSLR